MKGLSLVGLNEHAAPWVPLKALVSICSYVSGTRKSQGMLSTLTTAGYSNGVESFESVLLWRVLLWIIRLEVTLNHKLLWTLQFIEYSETKLVMFSVYLLCPINDLWWMNAHDFQSWKANCRHLFIIFWYIILYPTLFHVHFYWSYS